MAKVTFRNILEQDSIFRLTDKEYLIPAVYEYARSCDEEIYKHIMTERILLFVNSEFINVEDWSAYKLNEWDEIIITPPMGKDSLGAFFMIAVGALMIAAPYLAPSLFVKGAFFGGMAGYFALTGVVLGLGGISSLLFRPDLPSLPSFSDRSSQTYNWSGIKTMARCDIPVPIIYGTHPVGGNVISLFTEVRGDDNYLYMLIALGEGEIEGICTYYNHSEVCTTSIPTNEAYRHPAIDLDGQPLHYYSDVEWNFKVGTSGQGIIGWFDAARAQYDDGREINTDGITYTTTKEVDAATLHLHIPSLFDGIKTPGKTEEASVSYKVWYRKNGTATWYDAPPILIWGDIAVSGVDKNNAPVYTPTRITVRDKNASFGSSGWTLTGQMVAKTVPNINLMIISISPDDGYIADGYGTKIYTIRYRIADNSGSGQFRTFHGTTTITIYMSQDWSGQATSSFAYAPFVYDDFRITIYEGAKVGDIYNITVSTVPSLIRIVSGKTKTGIWRSEDLDFLSLPGGGTQDVYDIKIARVDGGKSTVIGIENNFIFRSIVEIVQGRFTYPFTALLGLKIKATGQLSGAPPNITTTVMGKRISVPDIETSLGADVPINDVFWNEEESRWETVTGSERFWNGTSWRTEYSSNSMLCVRDLILSSRYGIGDLIDSDDLYDAGILSVIKDCHRAWQPTSGDYFYWWLNGEDNDFGTNIEKIGGTIEVNSIVRELSLVSTSHYYLVRFKTIESLTTGERYTLSITLADTSANCIITHDLESSLGWRLRLGTESNVRDGTYTIDFNVNITGISHYIVMIEKDTDVPANHNLTGKITNISLTRHAGRKLHYHTYNGVIESGQSALTALLEMCDSFRTWPVWYDGKFNFVTDTDTTPIHTLSKGNTESFSQSFVPLSEIPYRLIGQYTDEDRNYEMTSLIAISSSTSLTKANEKTIGLKGLTHRKRAERELVWKLNKATNCTHLVNVKLGLDALHATAGDIINIQDDLPQWGYGGRILSYDASSLTISVNNPITITNVAVQNDITYQTSDNSFVTSSIDVGGLVNGDTIRTVTVQGWPDSKYPKEDAVFAAGPSGTLSKKFRLLAANRTEDDMVEFSALEHLSTLYTTEPTIRVIEDKSSQLPSLLTKPSPPTDVSVLPLPKDEGLGFILNARAPADGTGIIDIVVKIKKSSESLESFEIAAVIPVHAGFAKYINNSLEIGETYILSFECRNMTKISDPVYVIITIEEINYRPSAPTGIRVKNVDQNAQTFTGKDVTLEWNPVDGANDYIVEIYHTSVTSARILRTAFVRSESYTYSYENMIEDGGGAIYGVEGKKLLFRIAARHITGIESPFSLPFAVYNAIPSAITGMIAYPLVGGAQFGWNENTEPDHRYYKYSTKIGTGSWESDKTIEENSVVRTLTATEIDTYSNKTTIACRVKNVDWFNQESATWVEISASANYISDNLFQIFITSSGGAGTLASLIDGDYSSGGITIA